MVRGRKPLLRERITTTVCLERSELEILQRRGIELSELVRDAIKDKLAVTSLDKLHLAADRLRESMNLLAVELEYVENEIEKQENKKGVVKEELQPPAAPVKHPLNDPFPGSVFHHLHVGNDHSTGIYIPRQLHRSVGHDSVSGRGMKDINKASLLWLCEQDKI